MTRKAKKRSKLRHAEYYDMQNIFDELYAKAEMERYLIIS